MNIESTCDKEADMCHRLITEGCKHMASKHKYKIKPTDICRTILILQQL